MKKILRQITNSSKGFTFDKEERDAYEIDEIGAVYDIEVVKIKKK